MPFGRLKRLWNPWATLRFRLAFWNAATIVVLGLATLVGLREGLRYTLLREFDAVLNDDLNEVRLMVARYADDWKQIGDELNRKAESHRDREWFGRVFNGDGTSNG